MSVGPAALAQAPGYPGLRAKRRDVEQEGCGALLPCTRHDSQMTTTQDRKGTEEPGTGLDIVTWLKIV